MSDTTSKAAMRDDDEEEDSFSLDMTAAEQTYPEGPYKATITVSKWIDDTKNGGKQAQITTVFSNPDNEYVGAKLNTFINLNENMRWRWAQLLDALEVNWRGPDGKALKDFRPNLATFIDRELIVMVKDNTYQGRTTSQVGQFLALNSQVDEVEEATPSRRRRVAA